MTPATTGAACCAGRRSRSNRTASAAGNDVKAAPSADRLALLLIRGSLVGLVLAIVFFAVFPQSDVALSRVFGTIAGFPVAHDPLWITMRYGFVVTTNCAMLVLAAVLIVNLARRRSSILDIRSIVFALLSYAAGPGLVANGIFKSIWGRARPRNIIEFGGDRLFSSPLLPSHQCLTNCSFVSGEGSAVVCVALIALLLLRPRLDGVRWTLAVIIAVIYATTGSVLRIAFGGHFLSDTIFAALMMGLIVPGLYLLICATKPVLARNMHGLRR